MLPIPIHNDLLEAKGKEEGNTNIRRKALLFAYWVIVEIARIKKTGRNVESINVHPRSHAKVLNLTK